MKVGLDVFKNNQWNQIVWSIRQLKFAFYILFMVNVAPPFANVLVSVKDQLRF